jgi:hypothetical protein
LKDFDFTFENCQTYRITLIPTVVDEFGLSIDTAETKEVNMVYITQPQPPTNIAIRDEEKLEMENAP